MTSQDDSTTPIRVFVADDHPVYLRGLVRSFETRPSLSLVGEASDGRAAVKAIRELEPDVAVLDVRMPGLGGVDVTRALQQDAAHVRVLLLSGSENTESLYAALAAGARGYLLKTVPAEEICDAIEAVARDEFVFSPELHASLALEIRGREADGAGPLLSERELEVLRLTANGAAAADIAAQLFLSVATVRTHLQGAYQRLGVSDRAAAVAEAMRRGLID